MTKTRPVIGPACADAGNDTSNLSPADCGAGAACTLAASEKIVAEASPTKCLLTINLMPLLPYRREGTTFMTGTSRMILGIRKAVDSFLGRCSHGRTSVSGRARTGRYKAHGRSLHFGSGQEMDKGLQSALRPGLYPKICTVSWGISWVQFWDSLVPPPPYSTKIEEPEQEKGTFLKTQCPPLDKKSWQVYAAATFHSPSMF